MQDVGATATRRRREFKESIPYWGAGVQVDIEDMAGSISAFDANGEEKWRWRNELPMCASVLATGGDLVFAGEPSGEFNALDARTGELLWQFQCGSGHHSSPTTYTVDGRQYIAVPVGWGGWAEGFLPGMLGAGHGSALIVFALPESIVVPCGPAENRQKGGEPMESQLALSGRHPSSTRSECAPEVTMYVARMDD